MSADDEGAAFYYSLKRDSLLRPGVSCYDLNAQRSAYCHVRTPFPDKRCRVKGRSKSLFFFLLFTLGSAFRANKRGGQKRSCRCGMRAAEQNARIQ